MNREIAKRWVAALRSGEYRQGDGLLRRDNKFCCLGVLCDLYDKEHFTPAESHWVDESGYRQDPSTLEFYVLPLAVRDWAEVDSRNPRVYDTVLSKMNDSGAKFSEIAALIDQYIEEL